MKQNKKFFAKGIAYGCTLAMMLAMMTGCSAQPESKATAASDDSIYVQVTSVDGNTVTAEQGEWNGPDGKMDKNTGGSDHQRPDGEALDGEKPDGNGTSDQNPPDGNTKPDGNPPDGNGTSDQNPPDENTKPDGNPPEMNGSSDQSENNSTDHKNKSPFTSSGESLSFTVTDDTKIVAQSRDGEEEKSLSDISSDSILKVELDSSSQAIKITIMPSFGGMGGPGRDGNGGPQGQADQDSQSSSEGSSSQTDS